MAWYIVLCLAMLCYTMPSHAMLQRNGMHCVKIRDEMVSYV